MGEVYAARDTLLGRKVAIKVLHDSGVAMEETRLRFLQEARAASALNHPNIVTIYDVVRDGDSDCIVMELVAGETLDARMQRGLVPLEETLDILDRIADGLSAAHTRGIVHRDLKPSNVMLTAAGGLKILDFGLAKLLEAAEDLQPMLRTQSGIVVGTPIYMSPEQARGQKLDCRTDLFSLGSMGLEMLTGQNPFEADSVVATMHRIASGDPPPWDNVPRDVIPVFQRLLACNREDRYQSADELRGAIAEIRASARMLATPQDVPLWRRALSMFAPRK
jgi:serine/threonine protein kinase